MAWKSARWAREEISRLDPETDWARIAHLSFEVRFGAPIFVHALFSVAFAKQVAVPAIADVLYRNGSGVILSDTAKRNNDTLAWFGLLFKTLGRPGGEDIVRKIMQRHARFTITNDLNLYTLATLVCLPKRVSLQFLGRDVLSDKENHALYRFWTCMGRLMEITDIPADFDSLMRWMIDYELAHFGPSTGGRAVTQALADEFARRWFPGPLVGLGRSIYFALFDPHLLKTHGIAPPGWLFRSLVTVGVRVYFKALNVLPDPPERSLLDFFGKEFRQYPLP